MLRSTFALTLSLLALLAPGGLAAQPYLDNQTDYSNQDPDNETRRSDHIRVNFGHYNRDTTAMTEALAQGNLQMESGHCNHSPRFWNIPGQCGSRQHAAILWAGLLTPARGLLSIQ